MVVAKQAHSCIYKYKCKYITYPPSHTRTHTYTERNICINDVPHSEFASAKSTHKIEPKVEKTLAQDGTHGVGKQVTYCTATPVPMLI